MTDRLFRINDTIGDLEASLDTKFLAKCFQDRDELTILRDSTDRRGILSGRTGTGKTALLQKFLQAEQAERAAEIDPHNVALRYLSNTTILDYFRKEEIEIGQAYPVLWLHVLVLELLNLYFGPTKVNKEITRFDKFAYRLRRKSTHLEALEYVRTYGAIRDNVFWVMIEDRNPKRRRKEDISDEIKANLGIGFDKVGKAALDATSRAGSSLEEEVEIFARAYAIIDEALCKKLTRVFYALNTILDKKDKQYFIVVDHLNENWVDDQERYRLIQALIVTVNKFNSQVRNAKVIVPLQTSLLDYVLGLAADTIPGFQREKFSGPLRIAWEPNSLKDLLDARLGWLYTGEHYTSSDLLTGTIYGQKPIDYLLDRTLQRPRDAISFFNKCIARATGQEKIEPKHLRAAERDYSRERRGALKDEWSICYPNLDQIFEVLREKPASFKLGEISEAQLERLSLEVVVWKDSPDKGKDFYEIKAYRDRLKTPQELRAFLASVLYRVGAIGLEQQVEQQDGSTEVEVQWSYSGGIEENVPAKLSDDTTIQVHRMLWQALEIKPGPVEQQVQ